MGVQDLLSLRLPSGQAATLVRIHNDTPICGVDGSVESPPANPPVRGCDRLDYPIQSREYVSCIGRVNATSPVALTGVHLPPHCASIAGRGGRLRMLEVMATSPEQAEANWELIKGMAAWGGVVLLWLYLYVKVKEILR